MEKNHNKKNIKNNRQYLIMIILTIIVFVVIRLSFKELLSSIIYVDKLPKQPLNNIISVKKQEEKPDNDRPNNNKGTDTKEPEGETPVEDEDNPFSYVYTEDKSLGNYIYMVNQFPMRDEVGKELEGQYKTFDFKLEFKNKALGANYVITLEKMGGTDLDETWVKAYLTNESVPVQNCFRENGRIKTFNEYTKYNGKDDEVILYQGKVTESDIQRGYRSFTFRMWISEDVKVDDGFYQSKTIIARINVHANGAL